MHSKAMLLLAEAETGALCLGARHLEAQGYRVCCAQTAGEARSILYETPPGLIILDAALAGDSDFIAELRGITTAPVLCLAHRATDEQVARGLAQGVDDYLVEPYSLQLLSARVMALLRRSDFAGAGRLALPPLTVDLLSGRATLLGEAVALSQKELQLLACLVSGAGQVLEVGALFETIWGNQPDTASSHTVAVHISNLRKKLKLGDNSPFELRSVGGRGYMLLKVRYSP